MFHSIPLRLRHYALISIAWAGLTLVALGQPSLWDIDEGNNAEAAREMLASGNVVVPKFNYLLRSDKPALFYWLQIAAYRAFGINEFSARLPSALAILVAAMGTYELGAMLFCPATGFLAATVLASSVLVSAAGHFANPDALLLACVTWTLLLSWRAFTAGGRWRFVAAGAAAGLGILAKGPVAVALPAAILLGFLAWSGQLGLLWDRWVAAGFFAAALVALPWYIAVAAETKGIFLREFLLTHNASRFRAPMEGHGGPWFYFIVCILVGLAPWSVFLGATVAYATGRFSRLDQAVSPLVYRFLWCWIGVFLGFFSLSGTKLPNYVLPAYPALAILTARFLIRWQTRQIAAPSWVVPVSLVCLLLVGVGFGIGLLVASGATPISLPAGRALPNLHPLAWWGLAPVAGAVVAAWLLKTGHRSKVIAAFSLTAVLFVGGLAAWGAAAVDVHKSTRQLTALLPDDRRNREVRLAAYGYFHPSLVFYARREVLRLENQDAAVEFLRYPLEVFLFVSVKNWRSIETLVDHEYSILGGRHDLYLGEDVLVVTNRYRAGKSAAYSRMVRTSRWLLVTYDNLEKI
jgi:4-amino-4-deoxy-L-arabinose transferase-like glycosyltransferase